MTGTQKIKKKKNRSRQHEYVLIWSFAINSLWSRGRMKIASNWEKPKGKLINGQAYSGLWHGSLMSLVMCNLCVISFYVNTVFSDLNWKIANIWPSWPTKMSVSYSPACINSVKCKSIFSLWRSWDGWPHWGETSKSLKEILRLKGTWILSFLNAWNTVNSYHLLK